MIVRAAHPDHFAWLAERAQCVCSPHFKAIEAVRPDGTIAGMVGYDMFTPNGCVMHVALDTPAAVRPLMVPSFAYPFLQLGKGIVTATVASENRASVLFCQHLGFVEEHRIKDGWSQGSDVIIFTMRRENCRWIVPARKAA